MNSLKIFFTFAIVLCSKTSLSQRKICNRSILENSFEEILTKGKLDVYLIQTNPLKPSKIEIGARAGAKCQCKFSVSKTSPRVLTIEGEATSNDDPIYVRIHFNRTLQKYIHQADGAITTDHFGLVNSGSQRFILSHLGPGLVTMKIDVAEFLAFLYGSGDYEFSGVVRKKSIYNIKDFAFVNAFRLKSRETLVLATGNSTVEVTATKVLKIDAADDSQVLYRFSKTLQDNETTTKANALIQRVI